MLPYRILRSLKKVIYFCRGSPKCPPSPSKKMTKPDVFFLERMEVRKMGAERDSLRKADLGFLSATGQGYQW